MGRSHAISGLATGLLVAPTHSVTAILATGSIGAGAALLADIDIDTSTASTVFGPVSRLVSRIVSKVAGVHRGGTHGLLAAAGVTVGAQALALTHWAAGAGALLAVVGIRGLGGRIVCYPAALAVALLVPTPGSFALIVGAGYLAHELGDYVTCGGVPWLWPIIRHKQEMPILGTTGHWREHVVAGLIAVGVVYLEVAM
jgi:membrane-bound metal-dependent hydrolase YbcI (DUF457 family)